MRVGAYVDGLNVHYGGRRLCGRNSPGWRWLDLVALVRSLVGRNNTWTAAGAEVTRVVYCTALTSAQSDSSESEQQKLYHEALSSSGTVHIELGHFRPRVVRGLDAANGRYVSIATREEKGSDVNLASHLLIDLLTGQIDAAVLITNDSDLQLPARYARSSIPVGTVNPRGTHTAAGLRGQPDEGSGSHWWSRLTAEDFFDCQLPAVVAGCQRPPTW